MGSPSVVSLCCQDFQGTCQGYFGQQRLLPAGMHRIPCQMRSAGAGLRGSCGLVGSQDEKVAPEPPVTHGASLASVPWGLASPLQFPPAGFGSGGVIWSFALSQGQGEAFPRDLPGWEGKRAQHLQVEPSPPTLKSCWDPVGLECWAKHIPTHFLTWSSDSDPSKELLALCSSPKSRIFGCGV